MSESVNMGSGSGFNLPPLNTSNDGCPVPPPPLTYEEIAALIVKHYGEAIIQLAEND